MKLEGKKCIVTGGAGFIGSHLVDTLMKMGNEVTVIDNLSSGKMEFLAQHEGKTGFAFEKIDLLNKDALPPILEGKDCVFHLAANPDVRKGSKDTYVHLEQNIITTHNLLEAMRISKVSTIYFTSTSTVYGETVVVPTPESFGPLEPISLYGASKLACEALISAYCHNFEMESVCFRFANVIGSRSTHGVIYDFIHKLKADPKTLEILGTDPGTRKSYVHLTDTISGIIHACESHSFRVEFLNIGSEDLADVRTIAETVCSEMNLSDVNFVFTGGVDGGRGWKGDVKLMHLSIDLMKKTGWSPKLTSAEAIADTARSIISESE